MKRLSLFSFLLTIIFCLTSCEEPVVTVSSIILNSSALDMTEGDSFKLTATVRPDNATDKTLIWSSSNASIASVEDGLVTAVKEGAATITVASKDGGARATCEVTVATRVIDVESVTLDQKEATLTVGKSLTLKATVLPDNASDKTVTWTSNNTSVATVSNGEVKAVGVGSASITASAGGKNATCTITVKEAYIDVTSVTLSQTSLSLLEGEKATITATVKPSDATDKTVTWKSSDEKIVTVYGGTITAVKAGKATVTATAGEISATCEVQVTAKVAVTEVVLDRNKITIDVGSTETITATVLPDNATDKTVRWTSSDDDIATVKDGTVTGISEGKATITATAGSKSATCTVTVKYVPLQSIELDKTELSLEPEEFETLKVIFYPENATDKDVTWMSSNSAVASVSEYGRVTGIDPGTATITAKVGDLTATCEVKVINTNYLTITNTSKTYGEITFKAHGVNAPTLYLKYSTDGGRTWSELNGIKSNDTATIPLANGGSVRLYGEMPAFGKNVKSSLGWWTITADVPHKLSGDIMSLSGYSEVMQSDYQFYKLFNGDTKLEDASSLRLNIKELTAHCYDSMFSGCTALKKGPAVQAKVLAEYCCRGMFEKCTSLETAPTLAATTMTKADYCYAEMFKGCTALTKAPRLSATTMAGSCYKSMFEGCTALKDAPDLLATVLAIYCYQSMFKGCSALVNAPDLPAKLMATMCYESMFEGCSSLRTAPDMSGEVLATGCYFAMFKSCSKLVNAPKLPATNMVSSCYAFMFVDCQSLEKAPDLPATKLAASCYTNMFNSCTALTKTPVLGAEKLAAKCYERMFYNCRALSEVTCLATDISADSCTKDWLFYTASKGTFYKSDGIRIPGDDDDDAKKQIWSRDPSGIPLDWKVDNFDKE